MITSLPNRSFRSLRFLLIVMALLFVFGRNLCAQMGNDNPTGTSGVFGGVVTTAGAYSPYTGCAHRQVTDLSVAGAVMPLAFGRTMNSRYTPGAGTLEFGAAGSWRHNYQWSIDSYTVTSYTGNRWTTMPPSYSVNFPDGRRVTFGPGSPYFKAHGLSERFQQLTNPSATVDDCFLLLPNGSKVWFEAAINREEEENPFTGQITVTSTFTFTFRGLIDPHGQLTTVTYGPTTMTIQEPAGRTLTLHYISTAWNGDTVIDRVVASDGRSVKYNYGGYTTPNGTVYTFLGNVVYFGDSTIVAIYAYQNDNVDPNGRPLLQWAIDCMYGGPMWAIGYTFVPGSSGGVYGQLQSENYLDPRTGTIGVAVSTLSANGNTRTETRGDIPIWGGVIPLRTFTYSGAWLMSYTDFKGQSASLSYDANGYLNATIDQRQNRTDFVNESFTGKTTQVIHPLTPPDTLRASARYEYGNGNCPDPHNRDENNPYYLCRVTNERGHPTTYWRDSSKRVIQIDYPNGAYETFTYNGFGQVLTHRMTSGGVETFRYDEEISPPRGLRTSHIPPATPSDPNPEFHPTRYHYNALDRVDSVTNPRGHTTSFQYSARGQLTRVTHPDNKFVQIGYDNHGNRITVTDELNHTTSYYYDDYNRLLQVMNPLGENNWLGYEPYGGGDRYSHASASAYWHILPSGKQTHFGFDENLRPWWTRQAPGVPGEDAYAVNGYDAAGNLTSAQDFRGNVTTFGYDERNRRTSMTKPSPFHNEVTRWQYDPANNKIRETRPDQSFRRAEFDSMNRVIDTWGFANEHTHYDRDLAGNVWQMVDAKGAAYGFGYDHLNRKISASYPHDAFNMQRTESWRYDWAGNMDLHRNVASQYKHIEYDARNRPWHSYWNWSETSTTPDWFGPETTTAFDDASRITSVATKRWGTQINETTVAFGYDDANRKIWEDQTLDGYPPRRVETERDLDGNRENLRVFGYYDLRFVYNQRNQLSQILDGSNNPFATFTRDESGNITHRRTDWIYAHGSHYTYDELNRVTAIDQGDANQYFQHNHYRYDNLGREFATWRDEDGGKGEHFSYNSANQLTRAVYKADNVGTGNPSNWEKFRDYHYTPDLLNWSVVNDNGYWAHFANNPLNQYTSMNTFVPSYDGNFNQTTSYYGATFSYNAENQLVGGSMEATYDGLGRCVRRTVAGTTTLFTYDGWTPILEWDQWGNRRVWNVYGTGPDDILVRWDATHGTLFYKQDRRGSVTFLLDGANRVIEKYIYDAYGRPEVTSWNYQTGTWKAPSDRSSFGNRFAFTGREWIAELSIYDYRYRMYNPDNGRFLQGDPIGFAAGDANLFRYCGGDPVNRSDPFGLTDSWKIGYQNENKGQGFSARGFWGNPDGTPLGVNGSGPPADGRLGSRNGGSWVDGQVFYPNTPGVVTVAAFPSFFVPSVFSQQFGPGEISTLGLNPTIAWQPLHLEYTNRYVLPSLSGPPSAISTWVRDHVSGSLNLNVPAGGGNVGIDAKGVFLYINAGPGAVGELTATVNLNFGNAPSGIVIGGDAAVGHHLAGRLSAGWSSGLPGPQEDGGFFLNLGVGYGHAAFVGAGGGSGGYIYTWDPND